LYAQLGGDEQLMLRVAGEFVAIASNYLSDIGEAILERDSKNWKFPLTP
jgi:hypothetical protein